MHFNELIRLINKQYGPALHLRDMISRGRRLMLERNFFILSLLFLFLTMTAFALKWSGYAHVPYVDMVVSIGNKVWGMFLITFTITFILNVLEAMHRSYYFIGLSEVLSERAGTKHHDEVPIGWGVATIVSHTDRDDIVGGFLNSTFGQEILYRAGIPEVAFAEFIRTRTPSVTADNFVVDRDAGIMLSTYTQSILKYDQEFVHFLAKHRVNERQLVEAARWVSWIEQTERRRARWWSRDNLGRIPGIGKTWGYGETFLLTRYGHDLIDDHAWGAALMSQCAEEDEVEMVEQILARTRQSNALIIGRDHASARHKVMQLYQKIRTGSAFPQLEHKRIFHISVSALSTAHPEKSAFEIMLDRLMQQAVHAGDVIVYIENLSVAIRDARMVGADLIDCMMPYLESDTLQIITSVTMDEWNGILERDTRILQVFDTVRMKDITNTGLLDTLKQRALAIERHTGIVYCISALEAVMRLADQHIPTGVMPDKAFSILEELAPVAHSRKVTQLVAADVENLVATKTGIPVGTPTKEEGEKLFALERIMHERVVGQEKAVFAIAKALRRARAGVSAHTRPVGSFLFLGPTGVGKTETAKALAGSIFDSENALLRIDMSEFQGFDALERLIGSSNGTPGRLSKLIHERPHGVLLLDEFEKSSRDVHDLFLQILDEGKFTDAVGKEMSMRSMIIIATSNAGADLIWQWEKEGKDVSGMKQELVDALITQGIFKPEFLNRFDDIIIFHTLTQLQVYAITEKELVLLQNRVRTEHSIDVTYTPDMVEYIARIGFNPQFGGRPMRRVIQEVVEQAIADSILRGVTTEGSTLTLTRTDVEKYVEV